MGWERCLDIIVLSLSAIVANRIHRNFSDDAHAAIEKLIEKTLSILLAIFNTNYGIRCTHNQNEFCCGRIFDQCIFELTLLQLL